MRAYCVHCGGKPHVWRLDDDHGSYDAIGDHFVPDPYARDRCPGSGVRLIRDRTPPLEVRSLHADPCLTPTGITCVCPLQAETT